MDHEIGNHFFSLARLILPANEVGGEKRWWKGTEWVKGKFHQGHE